MAEENDLVNSAQQESATDDVENEQADDLEHDDDEQNSLQAQKIEINDDNNDNNRSNNDVELIDLSNDDDDEEDKDQESSMDNNYDENSINDVDMMSNNKRQQNLENGDEEDGDDDDDGDEDDDDDVIEDISASTGSGNVNGNMNNIHQQRQPVMVDDEIMISDDDDEDDDGPGEDQDDDDDDGDDQDDGESQQSSLLMERENDENSQQQQQPKSGNSLLSNSNNNQHRQQMMNSNNIKSAHQSHTNSFHNQMKQNQHGHHHQSKPTSSHHSQQQKQNNNNVKEEIIIDDDDEVQDLSTPKASIEDLIPKLTHELVGFPTIFKDIINIGDCIVINKRSRTDIDIDKEYSILDCPSQVVPLIIKKSNKFPTKLKVEKEEPPTKTLNPPGSNNQNTKNMLTISDFYSSSVGKFLIGIGLSRLKQWYHKDAINKVRKQIRKEGEAEDLMEELKKQQEYLNCCRAANAPYIFPTKKCEHCDFRTEFQSILNNHMDYPHTTSRKEYKCNFCQFSTRDSKVIIDHVNMMHERRCFIELPLQLYECPICPYESGVKSKAATHIAKCMKFFVPEKLLISKDDYFPTITPKPITQEDIKIYEATLQALRFAALNPQTKVPQIAGLPAGLQHHMYMVQQQQLTRIAPSRNKKTMEVPMINKRPSPVVVANPAANFLNQMHLKNVATPQLYQMLSNTPAAAAAPFLQNQQAAAAFAGLGAHNTLSLINKSQMMNKLPLPQQAQPNARVPNINMPGNKPNILAKTPSNSLPVTNRMDGTPKGSFVMCEICDGYIKDLEQLRTHMHWIHKVRIHPKMLASRPPLNCQKCQWRFFTDQGLERHLLGSHGLVTSNMQDMVNQNQDGGRCTICGRVFTSKLVTHMNQAHKINLKPAHLSYKCTVCSATFNLYRLFENHVYMVHSGAVKRNNAGEESGGQPPRKKQALDMAANGN